MLSPISLSTPNNQLIEYLHGLGPVNLNQVHDICVVLPLRGRRGRGVGLSTA